MNRVVVTFVFCALTLISSIGCIIIEQVPEVELIEGYLHTPEGKVKFKRKQRRFQKVYFGSQRDRGFLAEGETLSLIFLPWNYSTIIKIVAWPEKATFQYRQNEGYFRVGKEKKIPVQLQRSYVPQSNGFNDHLKGVISEAKGRRDIKSSYGFTLGLGLMLKGAVSVPEFIPEYGETFKAYIPFAVDDNQYLIDVTFKKVKKRRLSVTGITYSGP